MTVSGVKSDASLYPSLLAQQEEVERGDHREGREAERRWMADVGEKRETPRRRKMTEKTVRGFRSAAKS